METQDLNLEVAATDFIPVTMQELVEWEKMTRELAILKEKEMTLRKRVYRTFFKDPKEGTNTHQLGEGWLLKAQRKIDRKVDIGTLQALSAENALFWQHGINANELIDWKPELKIKAFKSLPEDKRKIFEQCLIIKDGSPQVDITLPARIAKAALNK